MSQPATKKPSNVILFPACIARSGKPRSVKASATTLAENIHRFPEAGHAGAEGRHRLLTDVREILDKRTGIAFATPPAPTRRFRLVGFGK